MRSAVEHAARNCPLEVATEVLGGTWKLTIVKNLGSGPVRFGALGRAVGSVTPRVLTRQLRELEEDGIVHREVFAEVPPRVEYSLTDLGRSLADLVAALNDWGLAYQEHYGLDTADAPSSAGL